MFELSRYLIDPSLILLVLGLSFFGFMCVLMFFMLWENKTKSVVLFNSLVLLLIVAFFGTWFNFFKNPDVELLDNPISYVEGSSRERLRINEEVLYEKVSTQLEVDSLSFQERHGQTITKLLQEGKGLNFTAVQENKAINGVVHFTEEAMVITVFEKSDETIIVPTND